MEFKVGDTVKILDRVGKDYNYTPIYTDYMLKYAGTITTIKDITAGDSLVLDNNTYYWDTKAVKLVNEDKYLHPSELKDGDFIKIQNRLCSFIYIFKEYKNNNVYRYVSFDLENSELDIDPSINWGVIISSDEITYATEEEKNLLNEALLKEGYIWNNLTKKLEGIQVTTLSNSSDIGIVNPIMDSSLIETTNYYPFQSRKQWNQIDLIKEKINKEELNLFPTKKHYQLNFNY